MSNALATIDTNAFNELSAALGSDPSATEAQGEYIPFLKVNYKDEDDDGHELKKGVFFVTGQPEAVYAKSVTFRPLSQMFRYMTYDPDAVKYPNRTILVPDMRREMRDVKGGVRCGKPLSKVLQADPELAKLHSNTKCYRLIYGLVSYKGTTATGEEKTVENVPVLLSNKGANFGAFETEFIKKLPQSRKIFEYAATLTTRAEKNGGSRYFVIQYDVDLKKVLTVDNDIFMTMSYILEQIKTENATIEAAYSASLTGKEIDESALKSVNKFMDLDPVDSDLDDDLPF